MVILVNSGFAQNIIFSTCTAKITKSKGVKFDDLGSHLTGSSISSLLIFYGFFKSCNCQICKLTRHHINLFETQLDSE